MLLHKKELRIRADFTCRNAAAALHAKGQLVVFKASLADSLPDSLADDDADAGHGRGGGDGERSDLVGFRLVLPWPGDLNAAFF